jgi:hypothetical protein
MSGNTTKRGQQLRNDDKHTLQIKLLHVRYHRRRRTYIFRHVTEWVMLVCVKKKSVLRWMILKDVSIQFRYIDQYSKLQPSFCKCNYSRLIGGITRK